MIKYFLAILFILSAFIQVTAQRFSMEQWHKGRVVLLEGDTLEGTLNYNFASNVVQIQVNGTNEAFAFSAQKILYFDFVDKLDESFRQFYSLPYSIKRNNYRVPVLFEVNVQGPLTLLSRESIENRTYSYNAYRSYTRPTLVYSYYLLDDKERIVKFDGRKKKDLEPFLKPYQKEVLRYMKEERLKVDQRGDLAKTIIFYNQLKKR
jgi:hypothetical protein